jgi:flagellar assembly protein FliH
MSSLLAPLAEQDEQLEKAMVGLVEHMTRLVIQRELKADSSADRAGAAREGQSCCRWAPRTSACLSTRRTLTRSRPCASGMTPTWRILEDDSLATGWLPD